MLRQQGHLRDLDMSGNPIAEEKDYRLHVVKQLPWLEVLDRHKVRRRLGLGLGQAELPWLEVRDRHKVCRRLGLGLGFGLRATIYEQSARHEWFLLTVDAPL